MCRCVDVSVPACLGKCAHLFASFFREISASPISMFFHHWYQLLAVWLEMMSSVTILLTIQDVGRPFWLPLLVSLSGWSLCIQKYTSHLVACRALTPQYIVWMTQLEIIDIVGLWYYENVLLDFKVIMRFSSVECVGCHCRSIAVHVNTKRSFTLCLVWLSTFQLSLLQSFR